MWVGIMNNFKTGRNSFIILNGVDKKKYLPS